MRKVLLMFVLIILYSCSSTTTIINDSKAESKDFDNRLTLYAPFRGFYTIDLGLYFLDGNMLKFYDYASDEVLEITSLTFCDDKPIGTDQTCDAKNYSETLPTIPIIQVYDNHIYYIVERYDIKSGWNTALNKIDLNGKNKETALTLNISVTNFLLHRGYLVYHSSQTPSSEHIIDLETQKEVYTTNDIVSRVFAEDNMIYMKTRYNDETENILKFDTNTQMTTTDLNDIEFDFPIFSKNIYVTQIKVDDVTRRWGSYYQEFVNRQTGEKQRLLDLRDLIYLDDRHYYFSNRIEAIDLNEIQVEITTHDLTSVKVIKIPVKRALNDMIYVNILDEDRALVYVIRSDFGFIADFYLVDLWEDDNYIQRLNNILGE